MSNGQKILVVDDDPDIIEQLTLLLGSEGYEVIDGEEPELVEVATVQPGEDRVWLSRPRAVAGDDIEHRASVGMPLSLKQLRQAAESSDRPVIREGRYGRLQQYADGACHALSILAT